MFDFDFIISLILDQKPEILFVCHESSRTGAPIYLISFIKWIKKHTDQPFRILIDKGGVLEKEFLELGPCIVLRPQKISIFRKLWIKINFRSYINLLLGAIDLSTTGIIYVNTFTTGKITAQLKEKLKVPVITHVHELEVSIRSTGRENIVKLLHNTDHFIAASRAVKDNLVRNHGIKQGIIDVQYSSINTIMNKNYQVPSLPEKILDEPGYLVGNAGMADNLKGYEEFLRTADQVVNIHKIYQIRFLWVGAYGRGKQKIIEKYIQDKKLQDHVFFIGEVSYPFSVYRLFNLFYLTSHADSFPLVMLENAYLGNPVIGFKGTGGIDEFLSDHPELLIPDLDIKKAAGKIIELSENRRKCSRIGKELKEKVIKHHMIESCGRSNYELILKCMAEH